MRWMQQRIAIARGAARNLAARRAPARSTRLRPARLVLRLDDAGLAPDSTSGGPLPLAVLQSRIAQAVRWLGPVPVTVLAYDVVGADRVIECVRFAHRLECRTNLVTGGAGLDAEVALALVDAGAAAVAVRVGGVTDAVHSAATGGSLLDARTALGAFVAARRDRCAMLDLEVAVPWAGPVADEARAVAGWARQAEADGLRVIAPYRAKDLGDPEQDGALAALAALPAPFGRTPAATVEELRRMWANLDGEPGLARSNAGHRRLSRCPIGGQRLEISSANSLSCCPFKAPIPFAAGEVSEAWAAAGDHLAAIRSCDRACAHVELVPAPLLPPHMRSR